MLLKYVAAVFIVFVIICPMSAETSRECTRPGIYFEERSNLPIPLDLIAPHPLAIQQEGPRLFAPGTNSPNPVPAPMRDFELRVASNTQIHASRVDEKKAELERKLTELKELQQQIDALRSEIGTSQQILVKVQMLEVSLTKMRQMGIEFSFVPGMSSRVDSLSDLQKLARGGSGLNAQASSNLINWLCENNVAKVLSRPNIVVVSGRPAQFCVGGEIPVPARNESQAIEFQKFGTELDLVACALGDDRVRIEIRTRVSELDEAHSIHIGDSLVPALNVRQLDTAIESEFGQSTMLSGAIQNRTEAVRRTGKDGKTEVEDRNNEVALVVIVTPEAVDPIDRANTFQ